MTVFHAGEIEVQTRLLAREDAERVGRIVTPEIPPTIRPLLQGQRMAVAASVDEHGRPWASLLTDPPGFVRAVDEHLLRLAVAPPPAEHIACGDVVDGCSFTADAADESKLVEKVVAHAEKEHGVREVTPELAARVKAAIQDR